MKKIKVLFIALIFTSFMLSGCKRIPAPGNTNPSNINSQILAQLPIQKRDFFVGTTGYFPTNFPEPGISDIVRFWNDTENAGDIYGINTDWKETNIIKTASEGTNMTFVLVLGFQSPAEWTGQKGEFAAKAKELLQTYPQIRYLGIGNEVNLLQEKYPNQFINFVNAYIEIYDSIKVDYPEVKVFSVFQLEAMKGEGYLTGLAAKRRPQWELLQQFSGRLDLGVFTTYPHMDYKDPDDIPAGYFTEISGYIDKPVAFTEVGWPSREEYGGKYASLNTEGFTGSEQEQFNYLIKFLELTESMDKEFVNWIFLNDFSKWENGRQNDSLTIFDSIGLRYNDGTAKRVWELWLALKSLEFV